MADGDWREVERRWEEDPWDQVALERAVTARRRAGLAVPGRMLDHRLLPPRTFSSERRYEVLVELPDGKTRKVGRTPGPRAVQLPRCRAWWVRPREGGSGVEDLVAALCAERVPGLDLGGAPLDNRDLEPLARAEHLSWLSLRGCVRLTGLALHRLEALAGLTTLDVSACEGAATGLRHLGATQLRHLGVADVELDGPVVEALLALQRLGSLRVGGRPVEGDLLRRLAELPELEALEVRNGRLADLYDLRALTRLRRLDLGWSWFQGGVRHLARLEQLTSLDLSCTNVSDAELADLPRLPALRDLRLYGCQRVTNKAAAALRELPNLRTLDVSHTKLSKTRVAALRRALPECAVEASV